MKKKVIIVGGVAGGASAAARLRRLDEKVEILLLERDEYISFANCGLPYYIGETIRDRSKLLVQTPEAMKSRFAIDVRTNSEVTAVDTAKNEVTVNSRERGVYTETYDSLILSPGARALRPAIPGIESDKILTLRNIPDTDRIKEIVDSRKIASAIVIGGGFVGIEMAENLKERGLEVMLVEAAPHILAPFDSDMSSIMEKELQQNGLELVLGDGVREFHELASGIEVLLGSGQKVQADLIILAIGVAPDTGFLRESGIALGGRGHILVNEKMETSCQDVFAVGDAIEVTDFVTGSQTAIPLAGPANRQGRIAADNVAGLHSVFHGSQGTSIIKVFGLTAAATGANERNLQKAKIEYRTVTIHPSSHATYYPGSLPMTLKLLFGMDGKILGAQGVGYDGVDKRIDVIATALRMHGTVEDLTELELSYAPPFSSAKDPVNMAGFAAQNVLEGRSHLTTWQEADQILKEGNVLLDVRSEEEYQNGHAEGALNIPVDEIRARIGEIPSGQKVIVYCQVGLRGYIADRILSQHGFEVYNITGGYKTLKAQETAKAKEPGSSVFRTGNKNYVNLEADTQVVKKEDKTVDYHKKLDACGLCCPGPLMQVKASMTDMAVGEILRVDASDPGFYEDIKAWCKRTDNELQDLIKDGSLITAYIRKGKSESGENLKKQCDIAVPVMDNKTMVVFSGDLDKAIASFIIANGAAAMGKKVTMFFTFWGLTILRKPKKVKVKKDFLGTMFGIMLPKGSQKLKLSRMSMMGAGGIMIRGLMKKKNVASLEELMQSALESGVEIVACQMSMDLMGFSQEELIDGVKIGGVGYYLSEAEDANVNLFI